MRMTMEQVEVILVPKGLDPSETTRPGNPPEKQIAKGQCKNTMN